MPNTFYPGIHNTFCPDTFCPYPRKKGHTVFGKGEKGAQFFVQLKQTLLIQINFYSGIQNKIQF